MLNNIYNEVQWYKIYKLFLIVKKNSNLLASVTNKKKSNYVKFERFGLIWTWVFGNLIN